MLKLIKNVELYAPEKQGKRDILIAGKQIGHIDTSISLTHSDIPVETIDGSGLVAVPGFIDSHVHITGGGGEGSFKTKTPEIALSQITTAGITTLVGTLGTDGFTRSMPNLLSKARALEEEGVTTYVYTGSYQVPVRTITGGISEDIIFIDKIIGAGEVAIADHRSSQPTVEELVKVAAAARLGGMLSGKAGIVNVHVGGGSRMIEQLEEIVRRTEIPRSQFLPTHMGRSDELLEAGMGWLRAGGSIDLTTGSSDRPEAARRPSRLLKRLLDAGMPLEGITFSSDGQGSLPRFDEQGQLLGYRVGDVSSLYQEVRNAVLEEKIPLEEAIRVITLNPARLLKLSGKGCLRTGYDADMVLLDQGKLRIHTVIVMGKIMVREGKPRVLGTFEERDQD